MPQQSGEIDFRSGQQSSNDALGGAIPRMTNVLVDATGSVHLRPGIGAWPDFGKTANLDAATSVDAISVWDGYPVYVTSDRQLHAQLAPGFGVDLSTASDSMTSLDGGTRPVIATTRARIVVAGGGALQKWEGVGANSARLGGNAPVATHVVKSNEQLIVNPLGPSGQIQWSDFGDGGEESWTPATGSNAGNLTLSADPDPTVALYQFTGELVGLGTRSVTVLDPDSSTTQQGIPVVWTPARSWTQGTSAPYSFTQNDDSFAFIDTLRRVQIGNGRSFSPISDPAITANLRALSYVADAWGFRMAIGSWDLLGWHFPTAGRTFVYDAGRKQWGEWSGFASGAFSAWAAKSHYFWQEKNLHLVGQGDGTIGVVSPSLSTDNGAPVVGELISGFQDFGSDLTKTHVVTRFYFRRGIGSAGAPRGPRCRLFWRDGTGAWEGPEELELGDSSDTQPVIEIRGLGQYRVRQWKLQMSDGVPITLVRVIETFEAGDM